MATQQPVAEVAVLPAMDPPPATITQLAAGQISQTKSKRTVRSLHPPYFEMIKDAISTLKEKTGSSQYAIAKFVEQKQKNLPERFKKVLLIQLKRLVAEGKLVKIKASYKLPAPTPAPETKPLASPAKNKRAVKRKPAGKEEPVKRKAAAKGKRRGVEKPKAVAGNKPVGKEEAAPKDVAKRAAKAKAEPVMKPAKVARTAKRTTPGKKVVSAQEPVTVAKRSRRSASNKVSAVVDKSGAKNVKPKASKLSKLKKSDATTKMKTKTKKK